MEMQMIDRLLARLSVEVSKVMCSFTNSGRGSFSLFANFSKSSDAVRLRVLDAKGRVVHQG